MSTARAVIASAAIVTAAFVVSTLLPSLVPSWTVSGLAVLLGVPAGVGVYALLGGRSRRRT
ncbi:MAG: hypothetical protein ACRDQ0_01795 [Pseudonocardia sp.]